MIDLDREMRALLEEDARHTPPVPEAEPVIRRTRRRQVVVALATVAVAAAVALGSVAGVAALVRTSERQIPVGPDETPSPGAIAGSPCPAGSTPDQPGPVDQPRPREYGYAKSTFDPNSGRVLVIADGFWTFDVCTNTWTAAPLPEDLVKAELVYDFDSDRAIAFRPDIDEDVVHVWTYEPDRQTWTREGTWAVGGPTPANPIPFQAAYDPVSGLVLVRQQFTSEMWTYDVDTDTWTEVDQGTILPPPVGGVSYSSGQLLAYDASVDRLILYDTDPSSTWEFDIRAGRWEEQEIDTPGGLFGWWSSGEELAYDEANEVSVLFTGDTLATYDASEHLWTVLQRDASISNDPAIDTTSWGDTFMTYDPVNERMLVAGCSRGRRCEATGYVIGFDVVTGESITLLEPTTG